MSRIIRLHTDIDLKPNGAVALTKPQAHYLQNVLRRKAHDPIHLFNGRDGEWLGEISELSKKAGHIVLIKQIKPQTPPNDIWILCAPVKKDRFDFCIEKSVELGASDFIPVFTDYTDIKRVNTERLTANAFEAAQQCGALNTTTVHEPTKIDALLKNWDKTRVLYVAAEQGSADHFIDVLHKQQNDKAAIFIGPEGGFSDYELSILSNHPATQFIHLGPLTLRTETALTSALALYQSVKGNWQNYTRDA